MALNNEDTEIIIEKIKDTIPHLRRGENVDKHWPIFRSLIENNTERLVSSLNTRWLVSIADTFADYGSEIEKRNAIIISLIANMEKLFATRLLLYDIKLDHSKVKEVKRKKVVPLWDGMTSFNIEQGDMTNNLFQRIRSMLTETPALKIIFEKMLERVRQNDTFLSDINKYHQRLFENPSKDSFIKRNINILIYNLKKVLRKLFFIKLHKQI